MVMLEPNGGSMSDYALLVQARICLRADDIGPAISLASTYVTRHPDGPEGLIVLAEALGRDGRSAEGLRLAQLAAALTPDDIECLRVLSWLHALCGNVDAALAASKRTVELEPREWYVHANYADTLRWAAEETLHRATAEPAYRVVLVSATKHEATRMHKRALTHSGIAITLAPDEPESRRVRGDCLRAVGKWKAAVREYEQILRVDPENLAATRRIAETQADARQNAHSLPWFAAVLRADPTDQSARGAFANAIAQVVGLAGVIGLVVGLAMPLPLIGWPSPGDQIPGTWGGKPANLDLNITVWVFLAIGLVVCLGAMAGLFTGLFSAPVRANVLAFLSGDRLLVSCVATTFAALAVCASVCGTGFFVRPPAWLCIAALVLVGAALVLSSWWTIRVVGPQPKEETSGTQWRAGHRRPAPSDRATAIGRTVDKASVCARVLGIMAVPPLFGWSGPNLSPGQPDVDIIGNTIVFYMWPVAAIALAVVGLVWLAVGLFGQRTRAVSLARLRGDRLFLVVLVMIVAALGAGVATCVSGFFGRRPPVGLSVTTIALVGLAHGLWYWSTVRGMRRRAQQNYPSPTSDPGN